MRAVITVLGRDKIGIIHMITGILSENKINVLDISQTILSDFFTMVMIVDIHECPVKFEHIQDELDQKGKEYGLSVRIQHEDIFNSMHTI